MSYANSFINVSPKSNCCHETFHLNEMLKICRKTHTVNRWWDKGELPARDMFETWASITKRLQNNSNLKLTDRWVARSLTSLACLKVIYCYSIPKQHSKSGEHLTFLQMHHIRSNPKVKCGANKNNILYHLKWFVFCKKVIYIYE